MRKFDVVIGLERARDARKAWTDGRREFDKDYMKVVRRLIHEGCRAFMSAREMANALGVPTTRVTDIMRVDGLSPSLGKRALSDQAARALEVNADLLGIEPHQMDLSSPLAYLPMGEQMRKAIEEQGISRVNEILETNSEIVRNATGEKCNDCRLNNTWVDGVCVNARCPSHHYEWCKGTCGGSCGRSKANLA